MTHWGWYWKIKRKHRSKRQCSGLIAIDSFKLFKNKAGIESCLNKVAYEIPRYDLQAILLSDRYQVTYNQGAYEIPIEKQPSNYGGYRYFLHCPQCDRRMRKLYCNAGKFLCRKCLNLCYYTQILKPSSRNFMMACSIEKILNEKGGDLTRKPTWMKQVAFERLRDRHFEYFHQKYPEACLEELLTYYPHKRGTIEQFF
jgi:hypothetical protein